jgi:hypothetical protein
MLRNSLGAVGFYNNHFAKHYTVAQLEALQLWQNMELIIAKLATLEGCAKL